MNTSEYLTDSDEDFDPHQMSMSEYLTDSDEGFHSVSTDMSDQNRSMLLALLSRVRRGRRTVSDMETATGRRLNFSVRASEFNTLPVPWNRESSRPLHDSSEDIDNLPHRCEPGFFNFGNTCFMNASLQCLFHCVPFVEQIKARGLHLSQGRVHQRFCILNELHALVEGYFRQDAPLVIGPQGLYENLREISQSFTLGEQQDAQEFIHMLFQRINEVDCNGCDEGDALPGQQGESVGPILRNTVLGVISEQFTCLTCHHTNGHANPFFELNLPVAGVTSVVDAIGKVTDEEIVQGENAYHCPNCNTHSTARLESAITLAPEVLILQLNRFEAGSKISHFLQYPRFLDVRPFMSDPGPPIEYELVSVVEHTGSSVNSGHYIAYVRVSDGHWCRADDRDRAKISLDDSLKQQAYILFYQRRTELLGYDDVASAGISVEENPAEKGQGLQQYVSTSDEGGVNPSVVAQTGSERKRRRALRRCNLC